ncbi:MAG TPA: phosphatidate cytidylyltransferase [Vicinamibacterales bacterium]
MTRLISALVLLPAVLAIIWFLPPLGTMMLLGVVGALAFVEYANLARQGSEGFPLVVSGMATLATFVAVAARIPLLMVLAPAVFVAAAAVIARNRPAEDVLRLASVTLFPVLYLALPLGLAAVLRADRGPFGILIPFLVIVVSDSAQYYGGRAFGRHKLAPVISPKKTVEGAVTGLLAAAIVTPPLARLVSPEAPLLPLTVLGLLLAAIGILGDLFESLLKRSTGVKDSSHLIPGHGGMLDRIDALLFACPAYYVFLRLAGV